ncbi:MAG: GatB/YqeY domain-containing protein, partial [Candidatus Dormiibacterota bacterium]
ELEREVAAVVRELGASRPRDMGAVMKAVNARLQGRAEPGRVAAIARRLLAA